MTKRLLNASLFLVMGSMLFASCKQESLTTDAPSGTTTQYAMANETSNVAMNDSLALVQFYKETDGENWRWNAGWLNDPLEYWRGVKVETINGKKRVVELRLGAVDLRGDIPAVLGQLSELRVLDLKWNERLTGSIPEELYDLRKLEVLNLRMTSITGELSPKIGQWVEMDTLNLRTFTFQQEVYPYVRNKALMTGKLPKEIGQLKKMRYLDLGRQGFSGELPEEIGNCVALEEIDTELCKFSGELPSSMRNLKNLNNLCLSYNQFSGKFPTWIAELVSLERLWLNYNNFEGFIPENIAKLPHLWDLELAHNKLSGQLPKTLASMEALRSISLGYNQLEGDFMNVLAPLLDGTLYEVDLSYNNFTGIVPDPVVYPTPLVLKGNKLTGSVPNYYLARPAILGGIIPQQDGYVFDNITNEEADRLIPKYEPDPNLIHFPDLAEFCDNKE